MSKIKIRKLSVTQIQMDKDVVAALEKVEGYNPNQPELTLDQVKKLMNEMDAVHNLKVQTEAALKTVTDDTYAKFNEFHDIILRVKKQVKAQFGEDSNEAQALGMKKKSEYKSGGRKKKENAA